MHQNLGRDSIGEAQIVCGRRPIDKDAYLISTCDSVDQFAGI